MTSRLRMLHKQHALDVMAVSNKTNAHGRLLRPSLQRVTTSLDTLNAADGLRFIWGEIRPHLATAAPAVDTSHRACGWSHAPPTPAHHSQQTCSIYNTVRLSVASCHVCVVHCVTHKCLLRHVIIHHVVLITSARHGQQPCSRGSSHQELHAGA